MRKYFNNLCFSRRVKTTLGTFVSSLLLYAAAITGLAAGVQANWSIIQDLNGGDSITVAKQSTNLVPGLFGRSEPARMSVQCLDNRTSVSFSFKDNYLSNLDDYANISLQLGGALAIGATAMEVTLERADAPDTLIWPNGVETVPFLKQAMLASTLSVGVVSFTDAYLSADFELDGLADALTELRAMCNW